MHDTRRDGVWGTNFAPNPTLWVLLPLNYRMVAGCCESHHEGGEVSEDLRNPPVREPVPPAPKE